MKPPFPPKKQTPPANAKTGAFPPAAPQMAPQQPGGGLQALMAKRKMKRK